MVIRACEGLFLIFIIPRKIIRIFSFLSLWGLCAFFSGLACTGGGGVGVDGGGGGPGPVGPITPAGLSPVGGPGGSGGGGSGGGAASPGTTTPPCDPSSTPWECKLYSLAMKAKGSYQDGSTAAKMYRGTTGFLEDGIFSLKFEVKVGYAWNYSPNKIEERSIGDKIPLRIPLKVTDPDLVPLNNVVRIFIQTPGEDPRFFDTLLTYQEESEGTYKALGELKLNAKPGDLVSLFYYENPLASKPFLRMLKMKELPKSEKFGGTIVQVEFPTGWADLLTPILFLVGLEKPHPNDFFLPTAAEPFKSISTDQFRIFQDEVEQLTSNYLFLGSFNLREKVTLPASIEVHPTPATSTVLDSLDDLIR